LKLTTQKQVGLALREMTELAYLFAQNIMQSYIKTTENQVVGTMTR